MSKFKIEIQITLLAVVIAAAVLTSGYFAYKSLSKIVYSIHQETGPDYKLFVIKDIAADLAELENNVRLYILTNNKEDLVPCDTLQNQIAVKLENLKTIIAQGGDNAALADSARQLSVEKLELWKGVLALHKSSRNNQPDFSELYSKLDEQKIDTVEVEVEAEKKGFLRKIFGGGKKVSVDTTYVERNVETDEIRKEIENLESEMTRKSQRIKILESRLIEQNIVLGDKMNQFIARIEKNETDNLIEKTNEADRLAGLTYKRLAAFSAAAVTLLLVVLFMLFNYMRKSRAYQQALKEAKSEAENLAKAKEQFASNVSHEMRTPVNAIYGLAEQLLQQKSESAVEEQISVIARSASHLKNIINDTLDFSKIQSKKLKIDAIHFSPADVFSEVITLQKNEAEKKGISLVYSTDNPLPEALIGDPMRLKQILINLVSNAIKFTDEGEVALRVKTIRNKEKYLLQMLVSDSGIGIPKENLSHIFDEFVQIENQSGKKYSGTGLGLAIVKKLVEMQDGKIMVTSEPNSGTDVTLTIPFEKGLKGKIQKTTFVTAKVPAYFKKLSVLVADDEEFNRFLMKSIFQKWGTRYQEVTNGIDAIEVAKKEQFDLILMDVRMPGKSGMEAAKAILEYNPETIIIAVTATNEQFDKEKCIKAGMKEFLLKPFSEKELIEKINTALKTKTGEPRLNKSPKADLQEARRFANGDEVFLKEMTALFIKTTNSGLKEIQVAANNKNKKTIAEVSHKMAAPCKHFLANDLYNTIKKLEEEAKNDSNWNSLKNQILILESEIRKVNTILTKHLNLK